MNDLRNLRIAKQIPAREMAAVVQKLYPKFDKTVQSKCENEDAYGVVLKQDAIDALYEHFAPELAERRRAARKDRHKLTCRISARLTTDVYGSLQQQLQADGYSTVQEWLTETVQAYIEQKGNEQYDT